MGKLLRGAAAKARAAQRRASAYAMRITDGASLEEISKAFDVSRARAAQMIEKHAAEIGAQVPRFRVDERHRYKPKMAIAMRQLDGCRHDLERATENLLNAPFRQQPLYLSALAGRYDELQKARKAVTAIENSRKRPSPLVASSRKQDKLSA